MEIHTSYIQYIQIHTDTYRYIPNINWFFVSFIWLYVVPIVCMCSYYMHISTHTGLLGFCCMYVYVCVCIFCRKTLSKVDTDTYIHIHAHTYNFSKKYIHIKQKYIPHTYQIRIFQRLTHLFCFHTSRYFECICMYFYVCKSVYMCMYCVLCVCMYCTADTYRYILINTYTYISHIPYFFCTICMCMHLYVCVCISLYSMYVYVFSLYLCFICTYDLDFH